MISIATPRSPCTRIRINSCPDPGRVVPSVASPNSAKLAALVSTRAFLTTRSCTDPARATRCFRARKSSRNSFDTRVTGRPLRRTSSAASSYNRPGIRPRRAFCRLSANARSAASMDPSASPDPGVLMMCLLHEAYLTTPAGAQSRMTAGGTQKILCTPCVLYRRLAPIPQRRRAPLIRLPYARIGCPYRTDRLG